MPKKDTPAKKTRKTKAKSTKAKAKGASARASVVSNIQNKIVIGDLGGSKKPRKKRAPNKPTQPQIPVAAFSSPYMTFGLPPQSDPPRIKENPVDEPPTRALLEAPPARALLEAPPTRALLEAPQQYARLEGTSMPSEPEEVPPQNRDLTLREPQKDSSIYNTNTTNLYIPQPRPTLIDTRGNFIPTEVRAPSIPAPPKQPLIQDSEDGMTFYDTSTFEDITEPTIIKPRGGRTKADERVRDLRSKLNDVNSQLKRGAKKESTRTRLLEEKQNYEDEIASLLDIPVSLSAKLTRRLPSAEDEQEGMGMEDFDASAMFSKPLVSEPSPLAQPLVARSSSAKKPLIYKKSEPVKEEEDDEGVTIIPEEPVKTPDDEGGGFYTPSFRDIYSGVSTVASGVSMVVRPLINTGSYLFRSVTPATSMPKVDLVTDGIPDKKDLVTRSTEDDKPEPTPEETPFETPKKKIIKITKKKATPAPEPIPEPIPEKEEIEEKATTDSGRKGAAGRRKEEWDSYPEGTQFELKYNKSGRIYTKQGNGLVDADGIQYKSLNDVVRKYKASIGDTKQFGSAWSMFKVVE